MATEYDTIGVSIGSLSFPMSLAFTMQLCRPPGTISREKWRLTLWHKENVSTIARATKLGGIALLFTR